MYADGANGMVDEGHAKRVFGPWKFQNDTRVDHLPIRVLRRIQRDTPGITYQALDAGGPNVRWKERW